MIWLSLTTYTWQDYDSVCGAFIMVYTMWRRRYRQLMLNNSTTINLLVMQRLAMQIAKQVLRIEDFKRNHLGGHIGVVLAVKKDPCWSRQ